MTVLHENTFIVDLNILLDQLWVINEQTFFLWPLSYRHLLKDSKASIAKCLLKSFAIRFFSYSLNS